MRVAHVFHNYYPILGGMERVVQKLAEEQAAMGHEVCVVTSTLGKEGKPTEEIVNDVRISRVRAVRLHYPDLAYPLDGSHHVFENSEVVHVHSQNSLFNIAMARRAKKAGTPLLIEFLALDYLSSHTSPLIRFFGGRYQQMIQREAVRIADRAVTLNEGDRRILEKKYGVKSRVVPHGIDEKYLSKPREDTLFSKRHGVQTRNVIACVGRGHASKGLDTLVRAVRVVEREVDDFIVIIAGGGSKSYFDRLIGLAKRLDVRPKVKLLGYIGEEEKMALLDSSKMFVFPTRHFGEAYPLVIDEAYARDVPVIAANVGVLPARVRDMETGLLVPPNDPLSLGKAMVTLLNDDELLKRIRRELRRTKDSLLTWRQVCEALEEIYRDMRHSAR